MTPEETLNIMNTATERAWKQGAADFDERDRAIYDSTDIRSIISTPALPGDTEATDIPLGVTTFQTIGGRSEQQDAYIVSPAPSLSSAQAYDFLQSAFEEIHRAVYSSSASDGSTANVVHISADRERTITVANAGDSRTVLFIRDVKTGKVIAQRLSCDHSTYDKEEQRRIKSMGGHIHHNGTTTVRIDKDHELFLNVSRGFGDLRFPGIIHEPEITQAQVGRYARDPRYEVYVVNSCDGIYPNTQEGHLYQDDLAAIMQYHLGPDRASPEQIKSLPKLFADAARHFGSKDNITVHVTPITSAQKQSMIIGTFDGHFGSQTSQLAATTMRKIIERNLLPIEMQDTMALPSTALAVTDHVAALAPAVSLEDQLLNRIGFMTNRPLGWELVNSDSVGLNARLAFSDSGEAKAFQRQIEDNVPGVMKGTKGNKTLVMIAEIAFQQILPEWNNSLYQGR